MSWVQLRCGFTVVILFLCLQSWVASVKLHNPCGVCYGAVVCLDSLCRYAPLCGIMFILSCFLSKIYIYIYIHTLFAFVSAAVLIRLSRCTLYVFFDVFLTVHHSIDLSKYQLSAHSLNIPFVVYWVVAYLLVCRVRRAKGQDEC